MPNRGSISYLGARYKRADPAKRRVARKRHNPQSHFASSPESKDVLQFYRQSWMLFGHKHGEPALRPMHSREKPRSLPGGAHALELFFATLQNRERARHGLIKKTARFLAALISQIVALTAPEITTDKGQIKEAAATAAGPTTFHQRANEPPANPAIIAWRRVELYRVIVVGFLGEMSRAVLQPDTSGRAWVTL